jgi:hypothetical protein
MCTRARAAAYLDRYLVNHRPQVQIVSTTTRYVSFGSASDTHKPATTVSAMSLKGNSVTS